MRKTAIHIGLKKRFGAFVLGTVVCALNLCRRIKARFKPGASERAVLILEPYGLGDLITLEPLIRQLRENHYAVRLSARAPWRPLYPDSIISGWLDASVPWSSYDSRLKYRWSSLRSASFVEYLREIRRVGAGSIGIDPRGDIRSVLLLHLAGCRRVLTLDTYLGTDLRVPACAAERVSCPENLRRWQVNLLFLKLLGVPDSPLATSPRLEHFTGRDEKKTSHCIGLVPIAPWEGKFWDREKWNELSRTLFAWGWEIRGLCGPGQSGAARVELGGTVPVEECADMNRWSEMLKSCDCLITVDTGPMHLADALGIPVIALFGQGKLPLWAPSGPQSRVISHQDDPDFFLCHPIEENAKWGRKFMSRISVDEVLEAVKSLAGAVSTSAASGSRQPVEKGRGSDAP